MKQLAEALAEVQKEIGSASKSSVNPHFKSKYADLSEVWDAWQKVGPKHGLSITQTTKILDNGSQALVTTLWHKSGENIAGEMLVKPTKDDMQGIGSALTYCRRYALAAMVGIVQDDDDGNAASEPANQSHKAPQPKETPEQAAKNFYRAAIEMVNGLQTRADLLEWQKQNEKAIDRLGPYGTLRDDLAAHIDDRFSSLPSGKAA